MSRCLLIKRSRSKTAPGLIIKQRAFCLLTWSAAAVTFAAFQIHFAFMKPPCASGDSSEPIRGRCCFISLYGVTRISNLRTSIYSRTTGWQLVITPLSSAAVLLKHDIKRLILLLLTQSDNTTLLRSEPSNTLNSGNVIIGYHFKLLKPSTNKIIRLILKLL